MPELRQKLRGAMAKPTVSVCYRYERKCFIGQIKLMESHEPAGQFNGTSFRDNNIGGGIFGDKIWRNNHVQVANLKVDRKTKRK